MQSAEYRFSHSLDQLRIKPYSAVGKTGYRFKPLGHAHRYVELRRAGAHTEKSVRQPRIGRRGVGALARAFLHITARHPISPKSRYPAAEHKKGGRLVCAT